MPRTGKFRAPKDHINIRILIWYIVNGIESIWYIKQIRQNELEPQTLLKTAQVPHGVRVAASRPRGSGDGGREVRLFCIFSRARRRDLWGQI